MVALATCSSLTYFASMLAYPEASLPETAMACVALLEAENPEAASLVDGFANYATVTTLPALEEAYTSIFDLDPKCALYVGYHLFGESYKRSTFLLGLNEHFDAQTYTPPNELADHLTVVLRSLAAATDEALARELITDAVLPALDRMTGRVKASDNKDAPEVDPPPEAVAEQRAPFIALLDALRLVLRDADSIDIIGGSNDG